MVLKNFLHFLFSIVLIFSLLGPSVYKLYHSDMQTFVVMDTSEEDKSGKSEEVAEEKLLQRITIFGQVLVFLLNKIKYDHYLDMNSSYVSQILVPPPEHTI